MGLEYYVVDKKNKRSFWLGKGCWGEVLPEVTGVLPIEPVSHEELTKRLLAAWGRTFAEHSSDDVVWTRELAKKLWAFCQVAEWNVEFRHDSSDYEDEYDRELNPLYRRVISRYREEDLDEDPCAEAQRAWENK